MQALADFPIDPQLVAAIERIYYFVPAPRQWREATYRGKATRVNNKEHKRQVLMRKHGKVCAYCGNEFASMRQATLDHVIPHEIVQHSQIWNLVLACESCNNGKGTRIPALLMPVLSALLYRLAGLNAAASKAVA